MPTIIAKINFDAIDQTKLFPGKKGRYLDVVLVETPNSAYGDSHMVVQGVTKEERQKGVKGPILGNAKTLDNSQRSAPPSQQPPPSSPLASQPAPTAAAPVADDLGF